MPLETQYIDSTGAPGEAKTFLSPPVTIYGSGGEPAVIFGTYEGPTDAGGYVTLPDVFSGANMDLGALPPYNVRIECTSLSSVQAVAYITTSATTLGQAVNAIRTTTDANEANGLFRFALRSGASALAAGLPVRVIYTIAGTFQAMGL